MPLDPLDPRPVLTKLATARAARVVRLFLMGVILIGVTPMASPLEAQDLLTPLSGGAVGAAGGPRATGIAADSITVGAVDHAIWTAAALHQILSERDYPQLLALALLSRPDASPETAATVANLAAGTGAHLQRCRGNEDPVEGTLCTLEALVPLLPGDQARGVTEEGARLLAMYLQPGETVAPGVAGLPTAGLVGGEGLRFGPLQSYAQDVVESSLRRHLTARLVGADEGRDLDPDDPVQGGDLDLSAELIQSALTRLVGFSPDQTGDGILAQVPELRALVRAHPGIASFEASAGGALRATLLDGETVLEEYRGFLTSVTGSARGLLDGRFVQALSGEGDEASVVPVADWATQRAFVYFASQTASLAGLESGVTERIRALGNAATDLRQEGYAFRSNLTQLGQQVATAALSGNVFTLASGVASFFQLTPDALGAGAAGEVRELRTLVEGLRDEMAEGFEGVDLRFDEVMETLDGGFARMENLVARSQFEVMGELSTLSRELAELGGRVDRLDANLVAYLQAGFDRDYTRTLIRCLEHRERHLPPFDRMEFAVFSECLTEFRARGARDARDALLTDRTTPVDDASLADALDDRSPDNLARRLPLLARAAEQRLGDTGMRGGRGGANPAEWAVASQAYLTMLQEWPEHAARVSPGDLEALLATGLETRTILEGAEGAIRLVLADYERGVSTLTEEADLLARRYQQAQLRRADPTILLGRIGPREVEGPTFDAPRHILGTVPSEVRTAAVLALEEPRLLYRTETTDSIATSDERRRWFLFGHRHDREVHVRTRIVVELHTSEGAVGPRYSTTGPMVHQRTEEMAGRVGSDRIHSTVVHISDARHHFLAEILPALLDDASAWQRTPPDPAVLQRLEGAIEAELRRFESASLNRVFGAVCADTALDATLDGPDRTSAERIRGALDGLRISRILLGAYVGLTLPDAAAEDPVLSELLYGEEALFDRGALCGAIAAGDSPLRVVWLEQEPRDRVVRLREALDAALARDALDGRPASMIDATIQQLRSAIRLQRVRAQASD